MHAPDGLLSAGTAVASAGISAGTIGIALRRSRDDLLDRQVPLAGLAAAFVFAAQMVNFPIGYGTSGHLLGGALAAVLLGPNVGAIVVAVVVVVQALVFADGGLTALGYNVLNMAVVTAFGGYAVFRLLRAVLPATATGVTIATGVAATASVVLSSAAFSIEWLFGATAPVPFDRVFGAMVGVHLLIGIGEGVVSALVVRAVLAARPDLVAGARDLVDGRARRTRTRTFAIWTALAVVVTAVGVSQLSASAPDGLERVALDEGLADAADEHPLRSSVFADYATDGVADERVSLAVAGASGVALTLLVGGGVLLAVRDRRPTRRWSDEGGDHHDAAEPGPRGRARTPASRPG